MDKTIRFAGINTWIYSEKRFSIWLGNRESHWCDKKHYVNGQVGRWGYLGLTVTAGGEDRELRFRIGLGILTLYLSITGITRSNKEKLNAAAKAQGCYSYELDWSGNGNSTGFGLNFDSWDLACLELELWKNPHGTHYRKSWFKGFPYCQGWDGRTYFRDWFGGQNYVSQPLPGYTNVPVDVNLPEKSYPATVSIDRVTYGWKYWPKKGYRASIDVPDGLPKMGKGENSWDCGRNDTYGITFATTDVIQEPEAVAQMAAEYNLKDRKRYGDPF